MCLLLWLSVVNTQVVGCFSILYLLKMISCANFMLHDKIEQHCWQQLSSLERINFCKTIEADLGNVTPNGSN